MTGPHDRDDRDDDRRATSLTREEREFVERSIHDVGDTSEQTGDDPKTVGETFRQAEEDFLREQRRRQD